MHSKHMLFKTVIQIYHKYIAYSLNQSVPNLFRISQFFEKSKLDFSRFYCILGSQWLFLLSVYFHLRSSLYAVTHVHNKNRNSQGSSPNVVKVIFHI